MYSTPQHLPHSGKFLAPGRPLPPHQIARARQLLLGELKAMVADHGLLLETGGNPDESMFCQPGLSLSWLCDVAEAGLKRLARCFSADLIGGANVTRLDRAITLGHPRLPYRRALRIAAARGWRLTLGDDLTPEAQASLIRFCGLLPMQVLYLPGQPQPASLAPDRQGFSYLVPWGGQVVQAELPLPGAAGPAVCRFRSDRLLQFILGLADPANPREPGA